MKPPVSINEAACYGTERIVMGCADPNLRVDRVSLWELFVTVTYVTYPSSTKFGNILQNVGSGNLVMIMVPAGM